MQNEKCKIFNPMSSTFLEHSNKVFLNFLIYDALLLGDVTLSLSKGGR